MENWKWQRWAILSFPTYTPILISYLILSPLLSYHLALCRYRHLFVGFCLFLFNGPTLLVCHPPLHCSSPFPKAMEMCIEAALTNISFDWLQDANRKGAVELSLSFDMDGWGGESVGRAAGRNSRVRDFEWNFFAAENRCFWCFKFQSFTSGLVLIIVL